MSSQPDSALPPTDPVPTPAAESDATRFTAERVDGFGDYELLEELGRGGMGVVYKARHLPSGRLVALKRILSGALASPQAVERFRTEAKAAAKLDHPHIVPVYHVDDIDGQHYFTMQLLTGGTLQQRLQQGPLPPPQAAALVRRLAEAVQHAHERGVVHRDIKPANVLIVESSASVPARPPATGPEVAPPTRGEASSADASTPLVAAVTPPSADSVRASPETLRVKLTDFGLARLTEGGGLTASGEHLGTPGYMAPEQAAGRAREVGPAADVYSLGALLYCLLVGRPPFQAATALETMRQVLDQEPVPPRLLNPGIPRDLETVCLKCLEKAPGGRYGSAAELGEELGRFLSGEPVNARPTGMLTPLWYVLGRSHVGPELRSWATILFIWAGIVWPFVIAIFVMRLTGFPSWTELVLNACTGALMILVFYLVRRGEPAVRSPFKDQIRAIVVGVILALGVSAIVFLEMTSTHRLDVQVLYPFWSAICAMGFFVAGNLWGRCYLLGIGLFGLAVIQPIVPPNWFHLIWNFVMTLIMLATGFHFRRLSEEAGLSTLAADSRTTKQGAQGS